MKISPSILFIISFLIFSCSDPKKGDEADFEDLESLISDIVHQSQVLDSELDTLAFLYQKHINRYDSLMGIADFSRYSFDKAFSSNLSGVDSSLSSIIILNTTPNRKKALEEVAVTNFLDTLFAEFYKNFSLVSQVYSNSDMQVSRVYPSYDHKNLVDPNLDVKEFNFYYAADEINNPSKRTVWIQDAYVDPAGKGWIFSLVHPVYKADELFAVLGADITVDDFIYKYFENYKGEYLLVNGKGDIIGGKSGAIELLSMPPLKNHVYRETVKSEFFRISDFNLFNSKSLEVRGMAQEFLLNKKDRFTFRNERGIKKAICRSIPEIDWYLIQIIPNLR
jgi:hypothetical protein